MSIEINFRNLEGIENAIYSMRMPYMSHSKSDSYTSDIGTFVVGDNDWKIMLNLCYSGPEHRKFMRMINAYFEIKAPLYWWKEFDTYKVATVTNSSSTMHTLHKRDLTLDDFSTDKLFEESKLSLLSIINRINYCRVKYEATGDKIYWYNMVQLLPSSYMQARVVMLNYETLRNIYYQRKSHKLDEWKKFCLVIQDLPCSDLLTT